MYNPLTCRFDIRVDYVFCGQGVRTQWKATDAWHCPQTISDHNAVFVVFDRHSCSEDPSYCSNHQEKEDVGEDLWQAFTENPTPEDTRKRWSKPSPSKRFKSGYFTLQQIETDVFSSAPAHNVPYHVFRPTTP